MALQLGALREALIDAGADPAKASRAAEEAATHEGRLAATDTRLAVLTWMVGGLYVLVLPAGWLLLRVAYKVGAVG